LSELKITSTARVTGNIESPVFTLERGGIFQGLSRMVKEDVPGELQGRKAFNNFGFPRFHPNSPMLGRDAFYLIVSKA